MRFIIFLMLFMLSLVNCKNYVKSLTESMGQEVIEIGTPIKDLPPGLDEEPSAEFEEDAKTIAPSTKREGKKSTNIGQLSSTNMQKLATANERRSDNLSQEEEEKRIEKELSEIYKDNDYKSDFTKKTSYSSTTKTEATEETKPVARQGKKVNFKFQPDVNDRADVERFRTSVDDISCEKRVTQHLHEIVSIVVLTQPTEKQSSNNDGQELDHKDSVATGASGRLLRNTIAMCLAFLLTLVCQ